MKKLAIFFLSNLILLFWNSSMVAQSPEKSSDSLQNFIEEWAGVWILAETPGVWDEEPSFHRWVVQLDPDYLFENKAAVLVSEYYKDGMADVLWFEYRNGGLEYIGAMSGGHQIDLHRIDYARIVPTGKRGGATLAFELLEAEVEYYVHAPLIHMPAESHPGWGWGLQKYFIAFLDGGSYEVLTAQGIPTTLEAAFGVPNLVKELRFMEEHPVLFPMFEEICLSASFDLIMLGSTHPGGQLLTYAIEWTPFGIYLYDTEMLPHDATGEIYIEKGALKCSILPRLPISPALLTQ